MRMGIVCSADELLKARTKKYLKRWRGKDGEWHYEYAKPKSRNTGRPSVTVKKPSQIKKERAPAKATMRKLNEYIQQNYGSDIEMLKGNGYFYYMGGPHGAIPSTYVNALSAWDMEGWKEEIDAQMAEAGIPKKGAGEKIRDAAKIATGQKLPESTYADVPEPPPINQKDRKALNAALNAAVPGDYFEGIPMQEMKEAVREAGYVILQEDGTEWSGMILGSEGEAFFELGKLTHGRTVNGLATYKPVPNSGLRMAWYAMNSKGRYEVIKYIT